MKLESAVKQAREFVHPFRVTDGSEFHLKDVDPGDTLGYGSEDKPRAREVLANGVEALASLQDMLYAQDRWALLLVFQAMDAAGNDGAIKHVMSGVNPQGCQVYSFKSPSPEELDHDYMWRCMKRLPERGRIGIFNRSYYEETIRATATKHAPWYVVPADNKWFTRVVVAAVVIDALHSLDLRYPKVGKDKFQELAAAKRALMDERGK